MKTIFPSSDGLHHFPTSSNNESTLPRSQTKSQSSKTKSEDKTEVFIKLYLNIMEDTQIRFFEGYVKK